MEKTEDTIRTCDHKMQADVKGFFLFDNVQRMIFLYLPLYTEVYCSEVLSTDAFSEKTQLCRLVHDIHTCHINTCHNIIDFNIYSCICLLSATYLIDMYCVYFI